MVTGKEELFNSLGFLSPKSCLNLGLVFDPLDETEHLK